MSLYLMRPDLMLSLITGVPRDANADVLRQVLI